MIVVQKKEKKKHHMNIYNHETPLHKITPPHPLYIYMYIKRREIKAFDKKRHNCLQSRSQLRLWFQSKANSTQGSEEINKQGNETF